MAGGSSSSLSGSSALLRRSGSAVTKDCSLGSVDASKAMPSRPWAAKARAMPSGSAGISSFRAQRRVNVAVEMGRTWRYTMQRPVTRSYLQAALACVLLAGCSEEDPPVVIEITVGWETTAFQDPPAVLTLDVEALDPTEAVLATASTTPGGTFSLGEVPPDQLLRIQAHGRDAGGVERMTGKSLMALAGGIESGFWPVFIQRIGAFARPPGELLHGHVN